MSLLKPTKNADFSYFFLLFPPAAAGPAPATPSVQNSPAGWENTMAVKSTENADFSYFFLFPPAAAAAPAPGTPSVQNAPAGWENTMAVKDGETLKWHPENA